MSFTVFISCLFLILVDAIFSDSFGEDFIRKHFPNKDIKKYKTILMAIPGTGFICVFDGCSDRIKVAVITGIILIAALISAEVTASEDYLYTGAWSYHANDPERHLKNETHNLLAYEKDGYLFGVFDNSYDDRTFVLAAPLDFGIIKTYNWKYLNLEFKGAITYGYWKCFGGRDNDDQMRNFCPAVIPVITSDQLEFNIGKYHVEPSFLTLGPDIYILSFRWKI